MTAKAKEAQTVVLMTWSGQAACALRQKDYLHDGHGRKHGSQLTQRNATEHGSEHSALMDDGVLPGYITSANTRGTHSRVHTMTR